MVPAALFFYALASLAAPPSAAGTSSVAGGGQTTTSPQTPVPASAPPAPAGPPETTPVPQTPVQTPPPASAPETPTPAAPQATPQTTLQPVPQTAPPISSSVPTTPPVAPAAPTTLNFPDAGSTLVRVPASYQPGTMSRWVLYLHGYNETAASMLGGNYAPVTDALLAAGYVVAGITNTVQNCYGNAQCNADVAATITLLRSKLNLEPQPYLMADSMGGFQALNSISSGSAQPKAAVGWCINTNLALIADTGGLVPLLVPTYGITSDRPYPMATEGHDPLLQDGSVFTSTAFALWSSYGDTIVPRKRNTDPFAAKVRETGGEVTVHTSVGNHLDGSNFDPAAVVAFFNAH